MFFVVLFAGSISYVFAAWSGPTCADPDECNVDAPINVGVSAQDKEGLLTLGNLGVFGASFFTGQAGYVLPANALLGVNGGLSVNGTVYANQYCNLDGTECLDGSTATTTPGGGGNQGATRLYLGPKGCDSVLTTETTCHTRFYGGCTGDGCKTVFYTCDGLTVGSTVAYVCKTSPTDLYINYTQLGDLVAYVQEDTGAAPPTIVKANSGKKVRISWSGTDIDPTVSIKSFIMKVSNDTQLAITQPTATAFSKGYVDFTIGDVPAGEYYIKLTAVANGRTLTANSTESPSVGTIANYTGKFTVESGYTGSYSRAYTVTPSSIKTNSSLKITVAWDHPDVTTAKPVFTLMKASDDTVVASMGTATHAAGTFSYTIGNIPTGDYYVRTKIPINNTTVAGTYVTKSNVFQVIAK